MKPNAPNSLLRKVIHPLRLIKVVIRGGKMIHNSRAAKNVNQNKYNKIIILLDYARCKHHSCTKVCIILNKRRQLATEATHKHRRQPYPSIGFQMVIIYSLTKMIVIYHDIGGCQT